MEYIFCYGFNHPQHAANLTNTSVQDLLDRCKPCTLKGFRRTFAGRFGESQTSIGHIFQDQNSSINTYAFAIKSEDLEDFDKLEDVPEFYERVKLDLTDSEGNNFEGYAYVMKDPNSFAYPTDNFFRGVALTTATFNYLNGIESDYENFEIEVYDYVNDKQYYNHKVKLTLEDYPEWVREKVSLLNKPN